MKLLIDQNLSYRLVKPLQALFPGTEQLKRVGLTDSKDSWIWEYARKHDFVVLTQDEDFLELSLLRGSPPKILLLRTGNIPSQKVVELITNHHLRIYTLLAPGSEVHCLELA